MTECPSRWRVAALTLMLAALPAYVLAQARPNAVAVTRADVDTLRAIDAQVDAMLRSGALRARSTERDPMLPDRRHERLDQYVRGVRIVGGDLTRQSGPDGTVSVFGLLHSGVDLDLTPALSPERGRAAIGAAAGSAPFGEGPELVVLPLSDGYHLAYFGQATAGLEIVNVYVDANSGALLQQYTDFRSEIGSGRGAYGDEKKLSTHAVSGTFVAEDQLRPGLVTTYDLKGDLTRLTALLNRQTAPLPSDVAADSDNVWTDPTVVDAHAYAGWYYDYLFKRFGRRGIDDNNLRIAVFTHPVRLQDIGTASSGVVGTYYVNAFFCSTCTPDGRGAVVLGEGAPRDFFPGIEVKPFSASFDVVAHELTHAVTASSARLNGFPFSEAGALNEAFSDIFGVSAAFYQLPAGNAPMTASYIEGRDLTVPPGLFARSMANPASTRDPDFYSQRNIGGDPHYNGVIVTHAFYLAIEGGVNRTSGLTVVGVGAANREQIEKAFFRALTVLMPSSATFALTRSATIQAARDLYGAGSTAERAITQAWNAVGVQERVAPTAALLPNPATAASTGCSSTFTAPYWILYVTASAGASSLQFTSVAWDFYDHAGALQDQEVLPGSVIAAVFNQCGPGSSRLLAQTDMCAAFCANLRGDTSGSTEMTFSAVDEAGRPVTFSTGRTSLQPR